MLKMAMTAAALLLGVSTYAIAQSADTGQNRGAPSTGTAVPNAVDTNQTGTTPLQRPGAVGSGAPTSTSSGTSGSSATTVAPSGSSATVAPGGATVTTPGATVTTPGTATTTTGSGSSTSPSSEPASPSMNRGAPSTGTAVPGAVTPHQSGTSSTTGAARDKSEVPAGTSTPKR